MKKFFLIFVLLVVSLSASNLYPLKNVLKYGYIDTSGRWVIKPKFDYASYFSEGLAVVKINGKRGVIDKQGNLIVKPKFDDVTVYKDIIWVKFGDYEGYVSRSGKYLTFNQSELDIVNMIDKK